MDSVLPKIFFLLLLISCEGVVHGQTEADLIKHLFSQHYDRQARPLKDPSKNVTVEFELEIKDFGGLDDQKEIMHFTGFFEAIWIDELLQWNLTEYPIDSIALDASTVWLPDFGIKNSAESFYHPTFTQDYRVRVQYTGRVRWYAGTMLTTMCDLDVSHFPFDEQTCNIVINNAVYDSKNVDLIPAQFKLGALDINGIWEVVSTNITKSYYVDDDAEWPQIVFGLTVRRMAPYYLLNLFLPSVLLTILNLCMFWLPLESGERISFGITLMLAFSVNLVVLEGYLPVTSQHQAFLGIAFNIMMMVATSGIVISISNAYLTSNITRPPSPAVKKFMFEWLARVMFMKSIPTATMTNASVNPLNENGSNDDQYRDLRPKLDISELTSHVRCLEYRYEKKANEDAVLAEWRALTRVGDRFFFWLSFAILLSTVLAFRVIAI